MLADSLRLTTVGLAIGVLAAGAVTRILAALLPQSAELRLSSVFSAAAVVFVVSILSATIPAVRAGRLANQRVE